MKTVFKNLAYNAVIMAGRPPNTPSTELGTRLASLRKTANLSQAQMAETIGIPQRTVSFYERQATSLPSPLIPKFADALGVPVEVVLGMEVKNSKNKRGPKSELEKRFDHIRELPRSEQQLVVQFLDRFIKTS